MTNNRLFRAVSLVLAFILVFSLFLFGCAGENETATDEKGSDAITNETTTDPNSIYDAEVKDLKGHTFTFYTKQVSAAHLNFVEVYAEALTGDKVNDAVFTRNSQLQEIYNCTITEVREAKPATVAKEALVSGEYVCDYIFASATDIKPLAQSGLVVDMNTLTSINLNKNWVDQDAIKGLNIAGKVFFLTGDACTIDDRRMEIMYFNKEYVQAWDPTVDLYKEVKEGKWTIDRMYQIAQATAMSLDDDDIVSSKADRFGYFAGYACDWIFVVGCGGTLSNYYADGTIEIPVQPKSELLDIWSKLRPLLTTNNRYVGASGTDFRDKGLGTFYMCNAGSLLNWGSANYKIGVLPVPKLNEQQEKYYVAGLFSLGGYAIPSTASNDINKDWEKAGFTSGEEMCAYFLEAFSYYSSLTLTPAFFDAVLSRQVVMDEESVEMLSMALENKIYDPVVGYNFGGIGKIFDKCGNLGDGNVGSDLNYDNFVAFYSSKVSQAREDLVAYLTFINNA